MPRKELNAEVMHCWREQLEQAKEIAAIKEREQKLLEVISEMQKALNEYGNRKNWRYESNNDVGAFDAWLDFKPDHACKTADQLGGYTARQAISKVDAILKEIGVGK